MGETNQNSIAKRTNSKSIIKAPIAEPKEYPAQQFVWQTAAHSLAKNTNSAKMIAAKTRTVDIFNFFFSIHFSWLFAIYSG